jgi:hypothetical protein
VRTTVTLDDDVATVLERVRRQRGVRFKELLNQVLREGIAHLEAAPPTRFETRPVDLGRVLVGNIDDVTDILDLAEGSDRSPSDLPNS